MLVTLMLLCTTTLRHRQRWWDDAPCPVDRAMGWQIDVQTGAHKPYATGLRSPTALAIQPGTGQLWAVVNERDEIGTNLVPDYLTLVQEGGFYGWPYSYWGQNVDPRVQPQDPDEVASAIRPDYSLGSHVAALGVSFPTPAMAQNSRMACSWASMEAGIAARPWA